MTTKITPQQRVRLFWTHVETNSPACWIWTGKRHEQGYGLIWVGGGRRMRAHRFIYELLVGPVTPELDVLHTCDVPECVNPAHLWLGTQRENAADMVRKGRHGSTRKTTCKWGHPLSGDNLRLRRNGYRICRACRRAQRGHRGGRGGTRGERHRNAKLTEAQVHEIRRLWATEQLSHQGLADRFGVSHSAIDHILAGRRWAWLTTPTTETTHNQIGQLIGAPVAAETDR